MPIPTRKSEGQYAHHFESFFSLRGLKQIRNRQPNDVVATPCRLRMVSKEMRWYRGCGSNMQRFQCERKLVLPCISDRAEPQSLALSLSHVSITIYMHIPASLSSSHGVALHETCLICQAGEIKYDIRAHPEYCFFPPARCYQKLRIANHGIMPRRDNRCLAFHPFEPCEQTQSP